MNPIQNKKTIPSEAYGKLPLYFTANKGQLESSNVQYYTQKSGFSAGFKKDNVLFNWTRNTIVTEESNEKSIEGTSISFSFLHPNPHRKVTAHGLLEGTVNYFTGNDPEKWLTEIPTYSKVVYSQCWSHIDLIFYDHSNTLKYDFILQPGAKVEDIRWRLEGAEQVWLDEDGNLQIKTPFGVLTDEKPYSYQEMDGERCTVESRFILHDDQSLGFEIIGEYNRDIPLVIDPTLAYSTYLGGSSDDVGNAITVDSLGNAYIAGTTLSIDFPTTTGAFQTSSHGLEDVFITKLNPEGTALIYSTYLGGFFDDQGFGITIDNSGNAYVTGETGSFDFPTTSGAFQTSLNGFNNAFITKLNPQGSALIYSTYIGGSSVDIGKSIVIDNSGNAYITGSTTSSNFPTTTSAFQTSFQGQRDAFITKLNSQGSALIYSTFLGGSSEDTGNSIAIDNSGNAYITGFTFSSNFPTTTGSFQTSLKGESDAFITKINPQGTTLIYSTYLGGSLIDQANGIVIDDSGNAYVTGFTQSGDFPTTTGAFQTSLKGADNAFITKLNPGGTALIYSTYIGGTILDQAKSIVIDNSGNAYITGFTASSDFPTTPDAFQTTLEGQQQAAFITKLNSQGSALIYSTYLGGSLTDQGQSIALDGPGNIYVTGFTDSTDFPITPKAYQTTFAGAIDAFITKFACCSGSIQINNPTIPVPATAKFLTDMILGNVTILKFPSSSNTIDFTFVPNLHPNVTFTLLNVVLPAATCTSTGLELNSTGQLQISNLPKPIDVSIAFSFSGNPCQFSMTLSTASNPAFFMLINVNVPCEDVIFTPCS